MSEADTREKLEADIREKADEFERFMCGGGFINMLMILGWLDRQAAITERECLVESVQGADAVLTAYNEELQSEIAKRDKGIERLKRSRDALKEERDKLMERLTEARTLPSVIELEDARRERDELKRERALMDDELEELERERDAYRELCGRFRKMAQEMANMEVD